MKSANLRWSFSTSSPPSVVRSCLFSGTMQTALGRNLKAISCISLVEAISKFSGIFRASIKASMSSSRI